MKFHLLITLATCLLFGAVPYGLSLTYAQSLVRTNIGQVDPRDEVAAVQYANSATQAAILRLKDDQIFELRDQIEVLRLQVALGEKEGAAVAEEVGVLRTRMTAQIQVLVQRLAKKDAAYNRVISTFRSSVKNIAHTPEGLRALALYNDGDRYGGRAIMREIIAAEDLSRSIEAAQQRRDFIQLDHEMLAYGELTRADLIASYEEIIALDPEAFWDWVELGRLYRAEGQLPEARKAVSMAEDTARTDRQHSIALDELGDLRLEDRDVTGALESYAASLEITEFLAASDPKNTLWRRDLSISLRHIADVQMKLKNYTAALIHYTESLEIAQSLADGDPASVQLQSELSSLYVLVGDVQTLLKDEASAQYNYAASLQIIERLAAADTGDAQLRRALQISHKKQQRGTLKSSLFDRVKSEP